MRMWKCLLACPECGHAENIIVRFADEGPVWTESLDSERDSGFRISRKNGAYQNYLLCCACETPAVLKDVRSVEPRD